MSAPAPSTTAADESDAAPSRHIAAMLGLSALWPLLIDDENPFATASDATCNHRPLNAMAPSAMESAAAATGYVITLVTKEQLATAQNDSQRDCEQLKRSKRHQQHQSAQFGDELDSDLLGVCFQFLDFASLSMCELVSSQWRRVLEDPFVWEQIYCVLWRNGHSLPAGECRKALLPQVKKISRARVNSQVEVCTRARTWMRKNGNVFSHNDSMQHRDFRFGCTESIRTERAMHPLACAQVLGMRVCYFEATVSGCGSVGLASVTTAAEQMAYGFGSESHLGWYPTSYGYHGDDGLFYWNAGRRALGALGSSHTDFGPQWGDTTPFRLRKWKCTTIGCGHIASTRELFYTLSGKLVGIAPVRVEDEKEYAAAVSLHQFGDSVEINSGCNPFAFDIEQFVWEKLQALRRNKDGGGDAEEGGNGEGDGGDDNDGAATSLSTAHAA